MTDEEAQNRWAYERKGMHRLDEARLERKAKIATSAIPPGLQSSHGITAACIMIYASAKRKAGGRMRVENMEGALLDYWVGRAEGLKGIRFASWGSSFVGKPILGHPQRIPYSPASAWSDGGPIVTRKRIRFKLSLDGSVIAYFDGLDAKASGPTPLIAAMRLYLRSEFGDEVGELPPMTLYEGRIDDPPLRQGVAAFKDLREYCRLFEKPKKYLKHMFCRSFSNESKKLETENNRRLIDFLYREILGRAADESGCGNYERALNRGDRNEGIASIVRGLMASNEYKRRPDTLVRVGRNSLCRHQLIKVNGLQVRHVISLGTHCLTSFFLKKYETKAYSLPFDWVFSSPSVVMHCIDDNFKTLLDQKNYISLTEKRPSKQLGADHIFYRQEFGVKDMFAHRDPTTDDDYRYFEKAASRFNALLKTNDAKLFVMISRPEHDLCREFRALSEKLEVITENSALLCIQLLEPTLTTGVRSVRKIESRGNHTLYEFQPSSKELGVGFNEPLDDMAVMQLVWQYDIDLAPSVN